MKFLLLTIGTRGDAEPFLTVGRLLQLAGHEVHIALPAQLSPLAEDAGLECTPFDERFLTLLEGENATDFMGRKGSAWTRMNNLYQLFRASLSVQKTLAREQQEIIESYRPERILAHPKCLVARAWGMVNPGRQALISPIPNFAHPIAEYPHIGIRHQLGGWGNRQSYHLVNGMTALATARYATPWYKDISAGTFRDYAVNKERAFVLISPTIYPTPPSWPDYVSVMGYFERPKTISWSPSPELANFIDRFSEDKITLISFGSMNNADPVRTTKVITDAVIQLGIPAIINTSPGSILSKEGVPNHIHFVAGIPYDWIFPRVHSVVHHGGSGTTHTAVRHGCASMIVPHVIDQFFWNKRIAALGIGPLGPPVDKLSVDRLIAQLSDLRDNESYRVNAEILGKRIAQEANEERFIGALTSG